MPTVTPVSGQAVATAIDPTIIVGSSIAAETVVAGATAIAPTVIIGGGSPVIVAPPAAPTRVAAITPTIIVTGNNYQPSGVGIPDSIGFAVIATDIVIPGEAVAGSVAAPVPLRQARAPIQRRAVAAKSNPRQERA